MAMILASDHKEEEQSRNTVIKPSTSINDLADQLLLEILQRVPCNSAFQCKSVSKRWFALISDPYFTHSFHRYHCNEKLRPKEFVVNFYLKELLITSHHPEVRFRLDLNFLPCFQKSQLQEACVVGSSNGLLLCCFIGRYQTTYYVCNPLTKYWVVLPPARTFPDYHRSVGFISYPSYDKSQCSFKVVRLFEFHSKESVFIMGEMFSSETGQWKDLVLSCPQGVHINGCFLSRLAFAYNGMLHWVMVFDKKILVYDPANDKVHAIIDCPKAIHPQVSFDCDLWRGCIRVAQLLGHNFPEYCSLKVWELTCYTTGKWQLMHQINLKEFTWEENSPLPKAKSIIPSRLLAFHPYEDGMYLKFKDNLVYCNLQTKTLMFACKLPDETSDYYVWEDVSKFVLPPWPTPVPALPHDALLQ